MSLVAIVLAAGLLVAANGPMLVATNAQGSRLEIYDEPGPACQGQAKRSVFQFGPAGDRKGERVEGCYIVIAPTDKTPGGVAIVDIEGDVYKVPLEVFKSPIDAPGNT